MTIHIFGDSYAHHPSLHPLNYFEDSYKRWMNMFSDEEEVINYSKPSASLYYCFKKINDIREQIDRDDKIIFLLSDSKRLDFPFLKESDHSSSVYEIYQGRTNNENETYLENWIHEIKLVFDMFEKEILNFYFYVISGLNYISKKIGCRILCLTCTDFLNNNSDFDLFFYNDKNFKVKNTNLFKISLEEFVDSKFNQKVESERLNHLSRENHVVLYHIISNFFYETKFSEKFHTNLYDVEGTKIHL